MELLVLDTKFESIAVVDTFKSLIWTDRYDSSGDFELYLAMDSALLEFLKKDHYLYTEDSEHCMIIEDIAIDSDLEEGNHIIITGRSLESILDRRIVWGEKVVTGNLQNGIKTLLDEAIISPTNADRKIDNFIFEESTNEAITKLTIDAKYTGDDLHTVISDLCSKNNIGFKIILNDDNQFVFSLYSGTDRSFDQATNPYVVFSPNFENIINSNYYTSKAEYKNITLVAGEGEGTAQVTTVVGSGSGLERRELFTDARNVSSENDGSKLSNSEYLSLLTEKGNEELSKHAEKTAFEGEVDAVHLFQYGKDFFIGDIVQIANEYGHEGSAYISELVISQDEDGISIYPTFKTTQDREGEST